MSGPSPHAPPALAMFPLSTVLFPHGLLPLHVFEERYRVMTNDCLAARREFGVVLIARGSEVGGGDDRCDVGTLAHIERAARFEDGRWALVVAGRRRLKVRRWLEDDPYPRAIVDGDDDTDDDGDDDTDGGADAGLARLGPGRLPDDVFDQALTLVRRCRALLSELGRGAAMAPDLELGEDPGERIWRLCDLAPLASCDRQRLLEVRSGPDRLRLLVALSAAQADDLVRMLSGPTADRP